MPGRIPDPTLIPPYLRDTPEQELQSAMETADLSFQPGHPEPKQSGLPLWLVTIGLAAFVWWKR